MAIGPWSYMLSRISTMGTVFQHLTHKQVCIVCQVKQWRINPLGVLASPTNGEDFAISIDPEAVAAKLQNSR